MTLLNQICSQCWLHSIREIEIDNFKEALIHFKGTEKYSNLLKGYEFDENNNSETFYDELANLILEEKVLYRKSNNSIFIIFSIEQINNCYDSLDNENSVLINSLLTDYRLYNTEKSSKTKKKSLI